MSSEAPNDRKFAAARVTRTTNGNKHNQHRFDLKTRSTAKQPRPPVTFQPTPSQYCATLAVGCIGFVRRPQLGKPTPKPNGCPNKRNTPPSQNQGSMTTLKPAWCRCRGQLYFMNVRQPQQQIHPHYTKARGPACKQNIRSAPAHD